MLDWFGRAKVEIAEPTAAITALQLRLDTLESSVRALKIEWEDVYDRLHKAAARLNARTRREKRDEEPPPAESEPDLPAVHSLGNHEMLSRARASRNMG